MPMMWQTIIGFLSQLRLNYFTLHCSILIVLAVLLASPWLGVYLILKTSVQNHQQVTPRNNKHGKLFLVSKQKRAGTNVNYVNFSNCLKHATLLQQVSHWMQYNSLRWEIGVYTENHLKEANLIEYYNLRANSAPIWREIWLGSNYIDSEGSAAEKSRVWELLANRRTGGLQMVWWLTAGQ